jgi:hypothetical protein
MLLYFCAQNYIKKSAKNTSGEISRLRPFEHRPIVEVPAYHFTPALLIVLAGVSVNEKTAKNSNDDGICSCHTSRFFAL